MSQLVEIKEKTETCRDWETTSFAFGHFDIFDVVIDTLSLSLSLSLSHTHTHTHTQMDVESSA